MPWASFRDHLNWFTKTKPTFDTEYASILRENQSWFDHLSGEHPKGLRDVLVHHSGLTDFYWTKHEAEAEYKVIARIHKSDGPREEDLYGRIREMAGGWCTFLDAACLHFVKSLKAKDIMRTMSGDDAESRWIPCWRRGLASSWVYPNFKGQPPYTLKGLAGV